MALKAYNLTASHLPLAAGAVTLPASSAAGVRGKPINVTGKFVGLTAPDFAALQLQVTAKKVEYEWDEYPEYQTPGLTVYDEEFRPDEDNARLIAYNKTLVAITLVAGNPPPVIPASSALGVRSDGVDVTRELKDLTSGQYGDIFLQTANDALEFDWIGLPAYDTGLVASESLETVDQTAGPDEILGTDDDEFPVFAKTVQLEDFEELGQGVGVAVYENGAQKRLQILQVFGQVTRGAPGAEVYLCCHELGDPSHALSDKFDASQIGVLREDIPHPLRVLEPDHPLFVYCSSDYVRGQLTVLLQRLPEEA